MLSAERSWVVDHPDGVCPAECPADIPAVGRRRRGRRFQDASRGIGGRSVSSVRCPLSGSAVLVGRPASSPSGVQRVQCPARPVSSRLLSAPSVRTRPSHPTRGGAVGTQVGAAGNLHHGNGLSPGGLPHFGAARSTAEQARTRAALPRSRVGHWGSVADPGRVVGGRRPRVSAERPGRPGRRTERRRWRLRCGHGSRLQREVAAAAAWPPPSGWVGDHGAWWSWVPDAGVAGPERARGLAGGDGRAARARPRLAAGAPGSLSAAL
jgi:hypothetical protein